MSNISTDELRKEISEILKDANLAKTSAKKVRLELESKLDVQLSSRRKEIDQLVMEYVNSREDDSEEEEPEEEEEEEEEKEVKKEVKKEEKKKSPKREVSKRKLKDSSEEEEEVKPKKASPKKKGRKKKGSDSDSDSDWGKKEKKKRGGSGYTRAYKLSPALAELMGQDSMARHEVVKRVWAIIKERQLYDQNNKQFAICDDELYKVFGTKRFRTFGMMKYLKTHFYD